MRPAAIDVELTGTLTRGMTIADWSNRWGENPTRSSVLTSTPPRSSTGSSPGSGCSLSDGLMRMPKLRGTQSSVTTSLTSMLPRVAFE